MDPQGDHEVVSARPLDKYPPEVLPVTYGTARWGRGRLRAQWQVVVEASDTDRPGREPVYLPW